MSKRHWETNFTTTFHSKSYPSISPTRPELSAAGKTVLVSGGGRGIGIGIVEAFAAAGAAHIIIMGRSAATLDEVAERTRVAYPSTKFSTVPGDVSNEEDVARAFAGAGAVDVVVANAGYLPTPGPIGEGGGPRADDWWRAWEVNVKGVFLLARGFLASARPGGVFVNVSALAAHNNPPLRGFSAYLASKIGAARLVETMQLESPGFRFYNVHPGTVESDMLTKTGLLTPDITTDERERCPIFFPHAWCVQHWCGSLSPRLTSSVLSCTGWEFYKLGGEPRGRVLEG